MITTIPIDWYIKDPIDFEHKSYMILGYLQSVDYSFIVDKKVSPYLLHLERLLNELDKFEVTYYKMMEGFNSNRYQFFDNPKLVGEDNDLVLEVKEIVGFSAPLIETRIDYGYKVLNKHKQLLY
jgi:hypothetical protein